MAGIDASINLKIAAYNIKKLNERKTKMKRIIAIALVAAALFAALVIPSFAYGMGGTNIYNSGGTKIGTCNIWNEPNSSPYTFGGEMTSTSNATLTVVLKPKGIKLITGTVVTIVNSPKSLSNTKKLSHTYNINSSIYFPTLAKASFLINGANQTDYQYSGGWKWN